MGSTPSSKPSVLLLSAYYPPVIGGAETAAAQLAEFLVARGHHVVVVTRRTDRHHPAQEERGGVTVVRVGPVGARSGIGKWLIVPAMFRALTARRRAYDVVVCIDYRAVGIASLLARRWTHRPVVFQAVTEGVVSLARVRSMFDRLGAGRTRFANAMVRLLQRLYTGADAYMCISHAIETETLAAGVARDRVHYLPNPVDTRRFAPVPADERAALRARLNIPADAHVAVITGRLSREKGQMDALAAWKICSRPGDLLLLVGPDMTGHPWNVGDSARAFVEREDLTDRVRFVGGMAPGEVPDWFRVADIAIQPSHFEAFGTAAIEAMAAGLPVIASDVGGLRDFVKPGTNGMRVPPQNPVAMAGAITSLFNDEPLRRSLAAGALRTARDFDTESVLGEFQRVVTSVAAI